jgi:hypothetical protein
MKLCFWKKREDCTVKLTRDSEAKRAKERAMLSQREATADHGETKKLAETAKKQRATNHFGPAIYNAMRKP